MPLRLLSILVAEGVALDQFTSRLTAFNLIDHVLVASTPSALVRTAIIVTYELADEADSFEERVRIVAPSSADAATSSQRIVANARQPGMPRTHRSLHMLWSVPLPEVGDYEVVCERKNPDDSWQRLSSVAICVSKLPHPILNAAAVTSVRVPVASETGSEPPTR